MWDVSACKFNLFSRTYKADNCTQLSRFHLQPWQGYTNLFYLPQNLILTETQPIYQPQNRAIYFANENINYFLVHAIEHFFTS